MEINERGKRMKFEHKPVLLKEVIDFLNIRKGRKYIDATLGGGGYSFEIVKRGGVVLGIDQDKDAIEAVQSRIQNSEFRVELEQNLILSHGNFRDVKNIAHLNNFEKVSGIVFDLGLSSYQIEQSGRGFSFLRDEPLDMRMNVSKAQLTASEIINKWSTDELYELFSKMGEERFSRTISNNIIRARRIKPIKTSSELARLVVESVHDKRKMHPATKVFQALRIGVNEELVNLRMGIKEGFEILEKEGRMVVVSFHSLEDRIAKNNFRDFEREGSGKIITKKPILAKDEETSQNPRSRSAKMRVIEKEI